MRTRRTSRHDALYQSGHGHAVRKPGDHKGRPYSGQCWTMTGWQASMLIVIERWDRGAKPCDRVALYLQRPWRIDRGLCPREGQEQGQVRHVQSFAVQAEGQARREQEAAHQAAFADAVEIAKLRDHLAGLVEHDDVVFLIGADPEIVVVVDRNPVRRVDAGD